MAASCCSNITRAMQEESAGLVEARASSTGSSSGVSFGKNNICEPRGLCAEWLRAFQALGAAEREVWQRTSGSTGPDVRQSFDYIYFWLFGGDFKRLGVDQARAQCGPRAR